MHTALSRPGARRAILAAIVIAQSIFGAWVYAAEPIKPLDVRDMRVMVSYVSVSELLTLQRKHGRRGYSADPHVPRT